MNEWRSKLKAASFKKVPFEVEELSHSSGRRTVTHEYANNDAYVEDMGRKASVFTITAFVIGDDYVARRDALVRACCDGGVGTLIHPTYGEITVICDTFTESERSSKGRMATFSLTFKQTSLQTQPTAVTDYKDRIGIVADKAIQSATADFTSRLSLSGVGLAAAQSIGEVASSLAGKSYSALEAANNTLADKSDSIDLITDAANKILDISSNALAILHIPSAYAERIIDTFDIIRQTLSPEELIRQIKASTTDSTADTSVSATTPKNREQFELISLLKQFSQRIGLANQAKAIADMLFSSSRDAQAMLDSFNEQIEEQLTSAIAAVSDDVLSDLRDLRASVNKDIIETIKRLPDVIMAHIENSIPSVVLAYDLYENINRAEEITGRNKTVSPGFIPAGRDIEVLSR